MSGLISPFLWKINTNFSKLPSAEELNLWEEHEMTNYEAIQKLSPENLAYILDSIYVAGLNDGLYAGRLGDEAQKCDILENNPFDQTWLSSEAEDATRYVFAGDGIPYVLKALAEAILRNAGVEEAVEEFRPKSRSSKRKLRN